MNDTMLGFPQKRCAPSAVSVGVFDGVHLGHKAVVNRLAAAARAEGLTPAVVTFSNHPDRILRPEAPVDFLLASLEHRVALLKKAGAAQVVILEFTMELAALDAGEFLRTMCDRLSCKRLVLGHDARIGKGGMDAVSLATIAQPLGILIDTVPAVSVNGVIVSSTRIRQLLYETRLAEAGKLLGRRFSSYGKVVPGRRRGRSIGFPTLNIDVQREVRPPFGVYAGWLIIEGRGIHRAVANIGIRPTFERPGADLLVETHVIGEELPDLYGHYVEFVYAAKLRDERLFSSPEELREQIRRDIDAASKALTGEDEPCSDDYVLQC